jgi:hypothetical protein
LKLLAISAQFWGVLIILHFLFTKKIITRDNYIGNNINYFLTNLPYRANGYEMIFTHILIHLLNEIKFLSLFISNKLTKIFFYPYPAYRIRYESGEWVKGFIDTPMGSGARILDRRGEQVHRGGPTCTRRRVMSSWVLRSALRRLHNSASSKPLLPPRLTKFALHPPKSVVSHLSPSFSMYVPQLMY